MDPERDLGDEADDALPRADLAHPFMPGASPLVDIDTVLRLEDAGASAIVMHSLFEEQISREHFRREHLLAVSSAR